MRWPDWLIVIVFFAISLKIGMAMRSTAGRNLESYFVSGRALGWWLAGTSIVATSFSSDTPLLITGMVRRRGVWGVWEVWALGISTMLAVFVFARLWKRANVMTEVELVERRYSGRPAAFLRGFKALYWGLLYNCYIIGVWPVTGMTKVLQETTGLGREGAIVGSVLLGALYTSVAGLWGVVLTDAFQFVWAMAGAIVLAVFAVHAAGGLDGIVHRLDPQTLAVIPPMHASAGSPMLESPFSWFLGLLLIQWWAWKNTDGGGVVVQRMVACKDERQATLSVLWFNVAHYALRSWPWVLTALASLVLIPNDHLLSSVNGRAFTDHELAYPRLIMTLLPVGLRGFLLASFFAAFLSTISTQLNWGASYLVSDAYKRFIRPNQPDRHYVQVARVMPFLLAAIAMVIAFNNRTIGGAFTLILNLTAGIGPVLLLRWFWWRVNPWSEITAMTASLPILLLRPHVLAWLGWPSTTLIELGYMVAGTALIWLPVTLLTSPVDQETLERFHAQVHPPGAWHPVAGTGQAPQSWGLQVWLWVIGTGALLATTIGPLQVMLGAPRAGWAMCAAAAAGWVIVWVVAGRTGWGAAETPHAPPESTLRTAAPSARPSAAG